MAGNESTLIISREEFSKSLIEQGIISDKTKLDESLANRDSVTVISEETGARINVVFKEKDYMTEFSKFLEDGIKYFEDILEEIETEISNCENEHKGKNREDRRNSSYKKDIEVLNGNKKRTEYTISFLNRLLTSYRDSEELNTQKEFTHLFYIIEAYVCKLQLTDTVKPSKGVMKYYVKQAKDAGYEFDILRFFDDEGNVIIESAQELRSVLKKMHADYDSKLYYTADPNFDEYIIVSKEEVAESSRISGEKARKIVEEKEALRKLKREEERSKLITSQPTFTTKNTRFFTEEEKLLRQYVSADLDELKPNVCRKIDLPTLTDILSRFLSAKAVEKLEAEYIEQRKNLRIERLKNILKKNDFQKLLSILKSDDNIDASNILVAYLSSEGFDESTDEEIKSTIGSILEEYYLKPTNAISNFLIFPNQELFDSEIEKITTAKTHATIDAVLKSIKTQLEVLQSHTTHDIRSNNPKAFHVLYSLNEMGKPLVIDNKLKGYRYGSSKSKVVFLTVGGTRSNIDKLKAYYKTKNMPSIMLVIGLGNVETEVEADFYTRVKSYAMANKDAFLEIYDIFNRPFTTETFTKAIDFIDNGFKNINSISSGSKDNSEITM